MSFFTLPSSSEVEITLIGTGGGYGESTLIKIGDSDWLIIDSCVNPNTKNPLAIEYLEKIGVDPSEHVKLVICTHWHDDHIRGMAKILEVCRSAKFCISHVDDTKKFLQFVGLDNEKAKKQSFSSTQEFQGCLDILKTEGKLKIKRASSDKLLHKSINSIDGTEIGYEVHSLSPSDLAINNFNFELSQLLDRFDVKKRSIVEKGPNHKSVVLYIKYLDYAILLGADLEVNADPNDGWLDIVNNSNVLDTKAFIFKIPHHGSKTGYESSVYNHTVKKNAILKLTPWNRKEKLSQLDMLNQYQTHSDEIYITSPHNGLKRSKKRDKRSEKIIKQFVRELYEVKFEEGIIRTRHNIKNPAALKTEVHGSAFKLE